MYVRLPFHLLDQGRSHRIPAIEVSKRPPGPLRIFSMRQSSDSLPCHEVVEDAFIAKVNGGLDVAVLSKRL
jgi:hypothetical protein